MRFRTKFTIIVSILLLVMGFGTVFSRRMQNKNSVKFTNKSKTNALEVANIRMTDDFAMVTLKNVTAKTVNGIYLSFSKGSLRIEFLDAGDADGQRLLPGATYEEMIPPPNPSEPLEVSVLAVAFEDKSGDGDPELVKEIFDSRRGYNKELKRIKPLLETALASPDGDSPAILERLKSQFEALPVERNNDSFGFRQGQTAARQDFLYDIQLIKERHDKTGQVQIRRALGKVKNRHDKRVDADF